MNEQELADLYNRRLAYRGRGLKSLKDRVDGVEAEITSLLESREDIWVLDVGCGFGTALLEIGEKYGPRVSLFGVNRRKTDGNPELVAYNAKVSGIPVEVAQGIRVKFADASRRLPFKDGRFDLVFSQASWLFIPDKIKALSEVSRILKPGGVGKIQFISYPRQNDDFAKPLLEIRDGDTVVDPVEFFGKAEGLTLRKMGRHYVAEVTDQLRLAAPLRLVEQVRLRDHGDSFVGVRSVYEIEHG